MIVYAVIMFAATVLFAVFAILICWYGNLSAGYGVLGRY